MVTVSDGGRVTASGRRRRALLLLPVLFAGVTACGKGGGPECLPAGTAEVCLSRGPKPELSAKGLAPGSQVIALEAKGQGGPPLAAIPPATAGPDGTFPSDGGSVTFVGGSEPVIILVTVTPQGAKPTTVTFTRD